MQDTEVTCTQHAAMCGKFGTTNIAIKLAESMRPVLTEEQARNLGERAQEFKRVQAQELELEMSRAAPITLAPADRLRSESFSDSDSDSESEPDGQWRQISPAERLPRYISPERPVLHPPGLSRSSRDAAAARAFLVMLCEHAVWTLQWMWQHQKKLFVMLVVCLLYIFLYIFVCLL